MRFYLIDATPRFLARSESEARRAAKAAGASFAPIEVPSDKSGLFDFLNELYASLEPAPAARADPEIEEEAWVDIAAANPPAPALTADRLASELTAERLEAMFTPPAATQRPAPRLMPSSADSLCEAISELEGIALGNVALEVAARFKALAARA